jgi:hypothetical protein
VLLCYDGSEAARRAITCAGRALGSGEAIVLTVWESLGSAILRRLPSGETEFGRDAQGIAEDVVDELDASTAERARETAAEVSRWLLPKGSRPVRSLAVRWLRPRSASL